MSIPFATPEASYRLQPTLYAERLTLRPLTADDAPLLAACAGDARVARGTRSIPHPFPVGTAEAFIADACAEQRDEDVWAIDGTVSGSASFLGVISLKLLDRGQSQIGYWVVPDFWHGGIASAAVRALLEANPHRNATVFAEVFQDNPHSAQILTNAGFEYIGDAEAFSVARDLAVPTWTYLRKMG